MANSPFLSGDAQWIWSKDFDDAAATGQFVLFRKSFTLETIQADKVLLHISADTRYRLYLNGRSISFGPAKSYMTHWNYETVDIQPHLRRGLNVLAAQVLRFSASRQGCMSMVRSPRPGLIIDCELGVVRLSTDTTWKATQETARHVIDESEWDFRLGPPFLSMNERVDGRLLHVGWCERSYDDSKWENAVLFTAKIKISPMLDPRRLCPREIPPLPETPMNFDGIIQASGSVSSEGWAKLIRNQVPLTLGSGKYTVDVESKDLTTGFVDFVCHLGSCEADEFLNYPTVEFLFAECYEPPMEDGKPRAKGDRTDYINGDLYGHRDFYIPHTGLNVYSPFWWRTFRYIRLSLTIGNSPVTIRSFTYRSTHYPLQVRTTVTTSSPLLTKLWNISLNTLKNCMHETYEDCPFYEQNQFAMDSRSQILFTYLLSRDDRLARKTMQEFYASRREDGLVETHFPNPGRSMNIPTFSLFWILMVYDHMTHFGDEKLIRRYIGAIDGILNYFEEKISESGLVGQFDSDCWAFVDWVDDWVTPGRGFTGMAVPKAYYSRGAATYHTLVYAYTLLKASELCHFLGRASTAKEYLVRQRSLIDAVQKHCYDEETQLFLDGPGAKDELSQHTQIFACLAGCVSGGEAKNLLRRAVLQAEQHGLAKASFAMGFYVFRAVSEVGVYEDCWTTLLEPWEKMITQKLTTWAESESMVRSDCHGWSATPLYEIGSEILGVTYRHPEYIKRVLQSQDVTPVTISPRRNLAPDIFSQILVGDAEGDILSISWEEGGPVQIGGPYSSGVTLCLTPESPSKI